MDQASERRRPASPPEAARSQRTATLAAPVDGAPGHRIAQLLAAAPSVRRLATISATLNAANSGLDGTGSAMPHLAPIQRSFGRHDVSTIQAHTGGAAASAARTLGVSAFTVAGAPVFGQSPDLHTAAHEAAHVVQQRSGATPATQRSAAGDRHERHADAVADRVVAGRSAEHLLDRMPPGPRGGAPTIQAKGGDIGSAKVLPRFHETPGAPRTTVRAAIDLAHQGGADARPEHNNQLKVGIEQKIASWVLQNAVEFLPAITEVTKSVGSYLSVKADHKQVELEAVLAPLVAKESSFGRLDASKNEYVAKLKEVFNVGGSMFHHLLIQKEFASEVYNKDKESGDEQLTHKLGDLIKENLDADQLKQSETPIDVGIGAIAYSTGHDWARKKDPRVAKKVEGAPVEPERGTDVFLAVENNAFVQSARLLFDMPMAGTGLSGSATDIFACVRLFGGGGDRAAYALAVFSFLHQAGAHSFHEVMLMARAAGFNQYVPGDYSTAVPDAFRARIIETLSEGEKELFSPEKPQEWQDPQDGLLHGWRDVITVTGQAGDWTDEIRTFLAHRFKVAGDAVDIVSLTAGRSGDRVYKVDIRPPGEDAYAGILKIFNDPDQADTEIEMGDILRNRKAQPVATPGHRGVARLEHGTGLSRSAVLFDRVQGESPADLIEKIKLLATDSVDRKPLLDKLKGAVESVAALMVTFHQRPILEVDGALQKGSGQVLTKSNAVDEKTINEKEAGLFKAHLLAAERKKTISEDEARTYSIFFADYVKSLLSQLLLRKSITHGDANAGNFIVHGGKAQVIDVQTTHNSVDKNDNGMKPAAADTGRFLESLRTFAAGTITDDEFGVIDAAFLNAYNPTRRPSDPNEPSVQIDKKEQTKRDNNIVKTMNERRDDQSAELYYRGSWLFNMLAHSEGESTTKMLKNRLAFIMHEMQERLNEKARELEEYARKKEEMRKQHQKPAAVDAKEEKNQ